MGPDSLHWPADTFKTPKRETCGMGHLFDVHMNLNRVRWVEKSEDVNLDQQLKTTPENISMVFILFHMGFWIKPNHNTNNQEQKAVLSHVLLCFLSCFSWYGHWIKQIHKFFMLSWSWRNWNQILSCCPPSNLFFPKQAWVLLQFNLNKLNPT